MSENKKACPICKLDAQNVERVTDYGERRTYSCARCGRYEITGTAEAMAESRQLGPRLSAWIRDINERGAAVPEIDSRNMLEIAAGLPDYSPTEKQIMLLRRIEGKTKYPGDGVRLTPEFDFPLAHAARKEELAYYLKSLIQRRLLVPTERGTNDRSLVVAITADGWDHLEKTSKNISDRTQAFVAMSFSASMKPVWEAAIKPAIERAGYKAYRIDAEPHIDRIDVKIISEIRNSRFLVAEATEQKHGVYFEAGYALALGLPVFWCVRKDDLVNVHFDTRQYNHIVWETYNELEAQLYEFISAIVGNLTKA